MVGFLVLTFVISLVSFEGDPKIASANSWCFGMAALKLIPSLNLISASLIQLRVNRDGMIRLHKDIFEISQLKIIINQKKHLNYLGTSKIY